MKPLGLKFRWWPEDWFKGTRSRDKRQAMAFEAVSGCLTPHWMGIICPDCGEDCRNFDGEDDVEGFPDPQQERLHV